MTLTPVPVRTGRPKSPGPSLYRCRHGEGQISPPPTRPAVDACWNFTKAAIPAQGASNNVAAAQAKLAGLDKQIKLTWITNSQNCRTVERQDKSGQLTDIQYQTDLYNIIHNYGRTYLSQGRRGGRRVEAGRDPVIGCHAAVAKSVPDCIATR
jgi:hypothetical protein